MYEEMKKNKNIDTIMMYKMIQALFEYDYYSTKCLVNELINKRTEECEVQNLKKIRSLIFYQKDEELRLFLREIIEEQERIKRKEKKGKRKSRIWYDRNRID